MAIDGAKLTAAAMPIEIGGNSWRMAPLTDKQFEEMNLWVRSQHVKLATVAAQGLDARTFDRVVGIALRESWEFRFDSDTGMAISNTLDGTVHLVWQSLRREQPALAEGTVRKALETGSLRDNVNNAIGLFVQLNRVESKNSEAPTESPAEPT